MKNTLLLILSTLLATYLVSLFTPWWSFVVVVFMLHLVFPTSRPVWAWLIGFCSLLLLWSGWALTIDLSNEHILSQRIAQILPLQGSSISLILVTGVVGGLLAGMAALAGYYTKLALRNNTSE